MRFSALLFLVCVIMTSFVDAHMYLRNPVSRGGLNNNGGTGGPCAGLAIGSGSVSTFSAGQTAIFQFRVNQHGPAPFEFRLSTGNDVFTTVLKANIENKVSAGPDGYNGVNVEIQIPNTPCSACAIQLSGMGQNDGTGKWWNCADIRIVTNFTGPVPDSIAPLAGPTSGGTEVTVTGTHFGTSAKNTIKCRFDMAEVEGKWESSTSITCKSPKRNQPTAAIVEVSLDDGKTYSTSGLTFDYTGDAILPEVLSVDPPFGLANTTLVVKGKNFFSSGVDCKFGNKTVHAVYVSETEVTCNIPDGILVGNSEEVSFETRVDGSDYSKSGKTVTILNETGMSGMVAGVVVGVAIFIVIIVGVVALLVIKRGSYGSETTPANWQKGRV